MRNSKISIVEIRSMHLIGEQLKSFGVRQRMCMQRQICDKGQEFCMMMQSYSGWGQADHCLNSISVGVSLMPEGQAGSQETVLSALEFNLDITDSYSQRWGLPCTLRICCSCCPRQHQDQNKDKKPPGTFWGPEQGDCEELQMLQLTCVSFLSVEEECDKVGIYRFQTGVP